MLSCWPSIVCMSVWLYISTSFLFNNLKRQTSIISDRIIVLVIVKKYGFWPLVSLLFGISVKLHKNGWSFLLTKKCCLCPGAITRLNSWKINYIKTEFEAFFLKFTAKDQSNKRLLWFSKYTPCWLSVPTPGQYRCINWWKKTIYKNII